MDNNWYSNEHEEPAPAPEPNEADSELELEVGQEVRAELGIGNDESLTPELLQNKLAEYQKALQQEYEDEVDGARSSDDVKTITQDYFRTNVPLAAAMIVRLAMNSTSDAVRGNMSKYIIQAAFDEEKDSGDPIKALLKELASNDPKPQPQTAEKETETG